MAQTTDPAEDRPRADLLAPGVIVLRQAVRATFRALIAEVPAILRVERGQKVLRGAVQAVVPQGALVLIPAHLPLDVENHPGTDGTYRATALLLSAAVPGPRGPSSATWCDDPRALAAFDRALALQRSVSVPQPLRDHAVAEVLLWLDAAGLRLPPDAAPTLADRVRRITGAALDRPWRAAEVARTLAMSEATLRRKLAAEGQGWADLLADQRMCRALGLLQTTRLSVGVIAAEVGYTSASRFAVRFRARFGISPGVIRKADRNGRKIDRLGPTQALAAE